MHTNTRQIAEAGRLLVQDQLRLEGIETDRAPARADHHLVIRAPGHLAGTTIRVQAKSEPMPGGGTGRLALNWMLDGTFTGDLIAVADLSTSRVWIFRTEEAFKRAQQHLAKGDHHLIMVTQGAGMRRSKHPAILDEHFRDALLDARAGALMDPAWAGVFRAE
ncbi:MAG TPA: hypothetical protein VE871_00620 [Longimicrobium sp.]|nr:hypothetical protein [Longimicrobium sp.]